jgi:hypothetical protein
MLTYIEPCIETATQIGHGNYTKGCMTIEKTIKALTCDYYECRQYKLRDMIFFSKPIIQTQRGEHYIPSAFLMIKYFSEFVYWTIKDYYNKSQKFVNAFGIRFEDYVYEILVKTYGKIVHRIEKQKKRELILY